MCEYCYSNSGAIYAKVYASKSMFLEFLRDFTVRSNGTQHPAAFASDSHSC